MTLSAGVKELHPWKEWRYGVNGSLVYEQEKQREDQHLVGFKSHVIIPNFQERWIPPHYVNDAEPSYQMSKNLPQGISYSWQTMDQFQGYEENQGIR